MSVYIQILHGLYLGNYSDAFDSWQLGINGITHIVSVHEHARPDLIVRIYSGHIFNLLLTLCGLTSLKTHQEGLGLS